MDWTKRNVSIIRLKLKDLLKPGSTQMEMGSKNAFPRIQADLDRNDSEALHNIATCLTVLHNRLAEISRSPLEMTDAVVSLDENIAVVEHGQTERVQSNQTSEGGVETAGTKDQ